MESHHPAAAIFHSASKSEADRLRVTIIQKEVELAESHKINSLLCGEMTDLRASNQALRAQMAELREENLIIRREMMELHDEVEALLRARGDLLD